MQLLSLCNILFPYNALNLERQMFLKIKCHFSESMIYDNCSYDLRFCIVNDQNVYQKVQNTSEILILLLFI